MKRIIAVVFVLTVFAGFSFASAWKNYDDYQVYKTARDAAKSAEASGDTFSAVANYKKAADLAEKSATADIQGWQLNNAAFVLINQFKTATAYADKLTKLEGMQPSKEKLAFQKEMAEIFTQNMPLLDEAKAILEDGKKLEKTEAADKIQSNLDFITWVTDFTSSNINGGSAEAKPAAGTVVEGAKEETKAEPKKEATATLIKPVVTKPVEK